MKYLTSFFINNKIATITKKDNDAILDIIKKYYAFEDIKTKNIKVEKIKKHDKVLT